MQENSYKIENAESVTLFEFDHYNNQVIEQIAIIPNLYFIGKQKLIRTSESK